MLSPLVLPAVRVRSAHPGPRARDLVEDFPLLTELILCPLGEIALHDFPARHLLLVWFDHSAVEEPLSPFVPSLQVLVEGRREHASERRLAGVRCARQQPDPGGPIVPGDEATAHIKLRSQVTVAGPSCRAGPSRGLALDENGSLPGVGSAGRQPVARDYGRPQTSDALDADAVGVGRECSEVLDVTGEDEASRLGTGNDGSVDCGATAGAVAEFACAASEGH